MKNIVLLQIFIVAICLTNLKADKHDDIINCNGKERTKSFLWAIKRQPPAYFFGTIHVPYTRVWRHIPQFTMDAFSQSDRIYFELDLTDSLTLSALMRCQMLPRGTNLKEVLPDDLYKRLKQHLDYVKTAMPEWITSEQKGKGMFADTLYEAIVGNWERKKPVWVMLMINSLTEADIGTRGIPVLDLHLARRAERMGKDVGAVEKVDEQCQPLNGLNVSQVIFALNHTLAMQEKLRRGSLKVSYTTDDLIKQYNCGDIDAITFDQDSVQVPKMKNESTNVFNDSQSQFSQDQDIMAADIDSYFKNELIYHRNERMAKRVNNLLQENPDQSFFFAFGAGHFLGNGSVIDFLKRYGYEIENVKSDVYKNKLQEKKEEEQFVRRRNKGRKKNRKRHTSLRKNKLKKRKQKRKTRRRNKWKLTNQKTLYEIFPSRNHNRNFDESEVRVINRYPTVFPRFYGDWTSSTRKKSRKSQHLKPPWNFESEKTHQNLDSESTEISNTDKSRFQSSSKQKPTGGSESLLNHSIFFKAFVYLSSVLIVSLVNLL